MLEHSQSSTTPTAIALSVASSFFVGMHLGIADPNTGACCIYLAFNDEKLNKCMENRQYLNHLFMRVKKLGFVTTQCDFSIMCGRTPTWFSGIKSQGLPLTTDAAITLSINLEGRLNSLLSQADYEEATRLGRELVEQAKEHVMKRHGVSSKSSRA